MPRSDGAGEKQMTYACRLVGVGDGAQVSHDDVVDGVLALLGQPEPTQPVEIDRSARDVVVGEKLGDFRRERRLAGAVGARDQKRSRGICHAAEYAWAARRQLFVAA